MATQAFWTEEAPMMVLVLEDAEDKLRGPQGEGEGDIEDMTTASHLSPAAATHDLAPTRDTPLPANFYEKTTTLKHFNVDHLMPMTC